MFDTNFGGRIFQVIEALDYGDAVSNQVVALDRMFKGMGIESQIFSKWRHDNVSHLRKDFEEMDVNDSDIVIIHYAGYSEHAIKYSTARCTKICAYHNITPHTFFQEGTDLYEFCIKGRVQLREVASHFDYFWGDSDYNLREIMELGIASEKCSLVPIIIEPNSTPVASPEERELGAWLFLGRVAANKGQVQLVELFAQTRATSPEIASKLYIVGGFNPHDPYYQALLAKIEEMGVGSNVVITGKVPDADVMGFFRRAFVYVSMSQHEGFGVPLIEATLHRVPVLALHNTAIGETLGADDNLILTPEQLKVAIREISVDPDARNALVVHQSYNATRFAPNAVAAKVIDALHRVIPDSSTFATVSVIICTYNRSDLLERCLDYLQYQTNQNFEVVVVNGPSDDNTDEVIQKYRNRIKVGVNPLRNLAMSRNVGIELADGDILAFIDDDALPFDDWVATLLQEFGSRPLTLGAIGGPVYYAGTLEYQAQDIGINKFAEAKVNIDSRQIGVDGWERSLLGTNTCFSAKALRQTHGFDEQFDYFLDESELCFRMRQQGWLIGYSPELYLRHEFAQSHNRGGGYKYNWFTICKNTAYYIAAYSGLNGNELQGYVTQRMETERIAPLTAAKNVGEITEADYRSYLDAIREGAAQGLKDAEHFPKTRALKDAPNSFNCFTHAAAYPLAERDIPRLHVCIVSKEFPPFSGSGGIGTLYYHLASELLLMGHYVTVVTPGADRPEYRCGRFAIRFAAPASNVSDALGSTGFVNNMNWGVSALGEVARVHAQQPIDVIESALWDTEALPLTLLPASHRPPVVVRLVTPFAVAARLNGWQVPNREAGLYVAGEHALIEQADAVVPISESIAATIEKEHRIRRDARWDRSYAGIAYWPFFDARGGYSVVDAINGKTLDVPPGDKMVLFVGRLEGRKGVDTLLSAASDFLATDERTHLVLAGRDIENWVERVEDFIPGTLIKRVHFLGAVDDQTREKLLNAAYCVVFPSRYESFGLVPLEAFVHGTPVVAARAGAIPEIVADDECGLLFEVGDAGSLAEKVSRMLADNTLRDRLSRGAKKQIRSFSSRVSAIRAVKLYATLIQKREASAMSNEATAFEINS